jgi:hypothetical protein
VSYQALEARIKQEVEMQYRAQLDQARRSAAPVQHHQPQQKAVCPPCPPCPACKVGLKGILYGFDGENASV